MKNGSRISGWRMAATSAVLALAALSSQASHAEIPEGWPWRINHLIHPTLGRPLILRPGDTFTLEFDCVGKGAGGAQPAVSGWRATLVSSNDQRPTETDCPVLSSTTGVSGSWPGDSTADYWSGSGPWAGGR